MLTLARRTAKILATAAVPASLILAGTTIATASPGAVTADAWHHPAPRHIARLESVRHGTVQRYRVRPVLNGAKLRHTFVPAGSAGRKSEPLTLPDDLTVLGHGLFTAFQNGVGPQGQPSSDGNTDSTVVEFTPAGHVIRQWDIKGKCDGITADPGKHLLIATVNEDASSSIYTITPGAAAGAQIRHYRYSKPLPSAGGTDAISIYQGQVLVSASAPGTTGKPAPQPTYPAVYKVRFGSSAHVATLTPLFYDEARATVANVGAGYGKAVRLGLTDPDSNAVVPAGSWRFGGDFMLTSQGDKEQIYLSPGEHGSRLTVLRLSRSVDDTVWPTSPFGTLYGANTSGDTVDAVTGLFLPGSALTAVTPCDANNAPSTCPGPGFPPNYLGWLNPWTGQLTRVPLSGPSFEPQGLVFVSHGSGESAG